MRILTAKQMREAEAAADAAGVSYEQLMENAGTAAAKAIFDHVGGKAHSVLILCGKGNNGGDGLVIARLLAEKGWDISLAFLCGNALSPLSQLNKERLPANVRGLSPDDVPSALSDARIVVDGIFGTGFRGALTPSLQELFTAANRADVLRVALDIPSGMNCDTGETSENTFLADLTLTFGAYKPALVLKEAAPFCGEVVCLDIGL